MLQITDACSILDLPDVYKNVYDNVPYIAAVDQQHALFLVICNILNKDENYDVVDISCLARDGGKIGIGDSWLNVFLKFSKVLRVHAAFHDAFGFMKTQFNVGPGYCYLFPCLPNNCLLGHISGICYWLKLRMFSNEIFKNIPV